MSPARRNQLVGSVALLALIGFFCARCYVKRLGSACLSPAECNSGVCLVDEAGSEGSYCTDECEYAADCPEGWRCAPLNEPDRERSLRLPKDAVQPAQSAQKNYCIRPAQE